jgi:hypothetical protein
MAAEPVLERGLVKCAAAAFGVENGSANVQV